jgi:hypothetical protein
MREPSTSSLSRITASGATSSHDRRTRHTFWIDDRIIDDFLPVMGRYPFGAATLAVYAVLARRADRDGDSWPSLGVIANDSGTSTSTVKRALRLLELLELVEIAVCYEQGSHRQTSHLYTLLTPPDPLPDVDPDPKTWPPAKRRTLCVGFGNRSASIKAARNEQPAFAGHSPCGEHSVWGGLAPREDGTPVQPDGGPPSTLMASPVQRDRLPPFRLTPLEGNPTEGNPKKEVSRARQDDKTAGRQDGKQDASLAVLPSFVVAEIGLSNRQVWAAALRELARRGDVGRAELESWLRPAALIGREGATLILGAPNAVSRDRIATRLLPAVREALSTTIGSPVAVAVEVMG